MILLGYVMSKWKKNITRAIAYQGHSINQFEFFFTGLQVTMGLAVSDIFWSISTRSRFAHGYKHNPYTTPCISANTAWDLSKILLGIFYNKLSIITLMRRFAGCFKGYFQIFEYLPWTSKDMLITLMEISL